MCCQMEKAARSPKTAAATSTAARPHWAAVLAAATFGTKPSTGLKNPARERPCAHGRLMRPPSTESTAKTTSGAVITQGDSCGSWPWVSSRNRSVPRKVSTKRRLM